MPKLLSRSKHEEFESNSSLQIRSHKERRAKSEEIMEHCKICILQHCSPLQPLFILLPVPAFDALMFFVVSSKFIPVIAFGFVFFGNFLYTEHLYKPQSIKTLYQSLHFWQ